MTRVIDREVPRLTHGVDREESAWLTRVRSARGASRGRVQHEIRSLLAAIPIAKVILSGDDDVTFTRADALSYLARIAGEEFSVGDRWNSFVNWMAYFFSESVITQEISEIALRRAQKAFEP